MTTEKKKIEDLFTAENAYLLSAEVRAKSTMGPLLERIKQAALEGKNSVTFMCTEVTSGHMIVLEELGYNIYAKTGAQHRDGTWPMEGWEVEWTTAAEKAPRAGPYYKIKLKEAKAKV